MKDVILGLLCLCVCAGFANRAAGQELPDELTLNVGKVGGVGTNVTLVLTKRSVRSDNYLCGIWSDDGFKEITFPVRTYRGHVKGDPTMRVNGSIGPDGLFSGVFSDGSDNRAHLVDVKVDVGKGAATLTMSTGNRVVPLAEAGQRISPSPGGYRVPPHFMRRTRWTVIIPKYAAYHTGDPSGDAERAVAQVEQRYNDGDFVYARDAGVAWEINTLVIEAASATKAIDWDVVCADDPMRRKDSRQATVHGGPSGNGARGGQIWVGGITPAGSTLLHEGGHTYGLAHHLDMDCMFGGRSRIGQNNTQIMVANYSRLNETNFPAVIYSGVLPPRAMDDFANTRQNVPITIDVLENDYDGNGDEIFLQAVTPASEKGGTVALSEDGLRVVYTPPGDFVGMDRFTYTVVDSTGVGNRTGNVKVDVRLDGLAAYYSFDEAKEDGIAWMWDGNGNSLDWRTWNYNAKDQRPDAEKLTYHFANLGPYGDRGTAHWIKYAPAKGVRGNGLLNPVGGMGSAQVLFYDVGDPGHESLSVSLWVLYPEGVKASGTLLSKGALAYSAAIDWVVNGWAIAHRQGGGFKFMGNVARVANDEKFELESEQAIQPNAWYHLVMVIDRDAKRLRAWVNNQEVMTTKSQSVIPDGVIAHYAPMVLFNGFSWKRWNASSALVDELKIFTSALTPEQVAELYAEGKGAKVPDLASK